MQYTPFHLWFDSMTQLSSLPYKLVLLGAHIEHSPSPAIHNAWYQRYALPATYALHPVMPNQLEEVVTHIREMPHYKGFNVTMPYKVEIMHFLDEIDDTARGAGAVNTVTISINDEQKTLVGSNSDVTTLLECLTPCAIQGKTALILGAGGAAMAALFALQSLGIGQVIMTSPSMERVQSLMQHHHNVISCAWALREQAAAHADIVIQATPLGSDIVPGLALEGILPPLVIDLAYRNNAATPLVQSATAQKRHVIDGITLLRTQAAISMQAWFGFRPALV
jgi:shikimate dehydrogenase